MVLSCEAGLPQEAQEAKSHLQLVVVLKAILTGSFILQCAEAQHQGAQVSGYQQV